MTPEELKKEIADFGAMITAKHADFTKQVEDARKDGADVKAIAQKAADTIAALEDWKTLAQKQLDDLEAANGRLAKNTQKHANFSSMLAKSLSEGDRAAKLAEMQQNRNTGMTFEMKAAANMLIGTNYSGGIIGLTDWDNTLSRPLRRDPFLRQLFRIRPVTKTYVGWAEMANRDGGAAFIAEGALKPPLDFDLVEATRKVEKVAVSAKASKEMMDDIPYFTALLQEELVDSVELEFDGKLYSGTGVSPEILGIKTVAQTISFAGTPFAGGAGVGVQAPNRADAIYAAISVVNSRFARVNYVLVNPLDKAMMMIDKDTQGNGLSRPYQVDGNTFLGNVQIVENAGIPVGEFLLGDFTKAVLALREDIIVDMGYVNDDFTRNLVTFRAEMRAAMYVASNNIPAFAKGTFAAVITAITKA